MKKPVAEEVALSFRNFLDAYLVFRKYNKLTSRISNVHEILTGMTDKHGRICRYIKHQERKDPKDDWPKGMTQALIGYLVYAIMLLEQYNIDVHDGMIAELNESIKQHGKR